MRGRWARVAAVITAAVIGLAGPATASGPSQSDAAPLIRSARAELLVAYQHASPANQGRIGRARAQLKRALAVISTPPTYTPGVLDLPSVFQVAGADASQYARLVAGGWKTVLFQDEDANVVQEMADARAHGLKAGLWHVPRVTSATAFAQKVMADDAALKPDVEVVDVEFIGKGFAGSPGWLWSETFAAAFRPSVPSAVSVMPNQDDFNYAAYTRLGLHVWPQAYGASLSQHFDPEAVAQRVVANGVPRDLVEPTLAAGQGITARPSGGYGMYRADYMTEGDFNAP